MSALEVIDPAAAHDRWVREHEWHLEVIPGLIEAVVDACLPQIPVGLGSRFDKEQLTGGGYRDNMQLLDRLDGPGPVADADQLWAELVGYLDAAVQVVTRPHRNVPDTPRKVNPDPLTARGEALVTIGWLIDHADQIAEAPTLTREPTDLFALVRALRGRYGVFPHPRRAKPEDCGLCLAKATVLTSWATSGTGVRHSVEVKTCQTCGDTSREDEERENAS